MLGGELQTAAWVSPLSGLMGPGVEDMKGSAPLCASQALDRLGDQIDKGMGGESRRKQWILVICRGFVLRSHHEH